MEPQYHPTVVKFFKVLTKYTDVTVREFVEVSTKYNHGNIHSAHDVILKIMSNGHTSVDRCISWTRAEGNGSRSRDRWSAIDNYVMNNWDRVEEEEV